ncbi:MAG TPA: enoyl-CoA hydratase/isomerase family protein [Acidiphilium sp.]|jgi:enoyl-CoA hydratase|nr:MAG: 3-hydroxyisobutyryl-CoA hydrolase [Acidiphilium sp. 21-60-14]OYV90288.1 MAG: 3-hydroxyisobutyryl-CoA hydrolase [Acidiphilium sp. 37-60-79]OZB38383.1 MAG: 3-hydroxyisobutyryl-CoA hydrolase [Acidiphilium sp. 34-60-192]HQT89058.1 enoyl-CoA hydratase/isomerase family protein [Acidiphilium sp.]HQU24340.1 enoyl-CoA hydratase/isomerase family protein [Acidiphilium sp.]
MTNAPSSDVVVRVTGHVGRITLNRPRALNALTLDMVSEINAALAQWADDPAILAVIVDGAGERGLCAGGDIRSLYDAAKSENLNLPKRFFAIEYRMNARIAAFPKPYIPIMDGIVMGGGIGLSAHGNHRLVTARATLAMPEVGIGFIPDVGGTFLLARAPDQLGTHAALTAARLTGADALALRLADSMIDAAAIPQLIADLESCSSLEQLLIRIDRAKIEPNSSTLASERAWITRCYHADTIEQILKNLDNDPEPAAQAAAATIRRQSPSALKLTLRALRRAATLSGLPACLDQEYRIALRCMTSHDFIEGVRAAVIDKDRTPRWQPATLEHVTPTMLDPYFASLGHDELGLDIATL